MTVDPAINFMVFDMLKNILSLADNPDHLGTYITVQMRELVGAKSVVLLRHNDTKGSEPHTLLGICPERQRANVEMARLNAVANASHALHTATIVRHQDASGELAGHLQSLGGHTSIIVPLEYGTRRVGLLLMIDILDLHNIESVLDALKSLSGVLALEIRNAGFYQILELTVEERTRELRENENRLRTLITQAPIGIALSRDGITLETNPAYLRMFGYSDLGELYDTPLINQIAPQCREEILQRIRFRMEGKSTETSYESIGLRKDGSQFPFLVSVSRIMLSDGPLTFSFFTDLTERRTSESILRDVQRRESLGVLTSGIAHDFNNLLGTMMGNISLAQARLAPDHPAAANIAKALSAMEHAADLTKQMLAYSGKGKFQTRPVDLAAFVQEHIRLFTISLPKNVKLETRLSPEPLFVNGDPGQIEQVVMNLIINGGDAIGEAQGTVVIDVSAVHLREKELRPFGTLTNAVLNEGDFVLLRVEDNGCGMNGDTLTKIFDPFFTTKFTGRGLGLSAVLGIIRGHEGGITIDSAVGLGTTFRVLLPMMKAPVSAAEIPDRTPVPHAPLTTTVLIIDDEKDLATTAQDMLESGHHKTLTEVNPIRGIERYRQQRGDIGVVLLDLTMPEMSGKEVADALRSIDPNVKIIISSGYTEDVVVEKLQSVEVAGFIQKPYRLQTLLELVQKIIQLDREPHAGHIADNDSIIEG